MLNAVCDSGPLIHLAQINLLKTFKIFQELTVPRSVFDEVTISGKPGEVEIRSLENLTTVDISKDELRQITVLKRRLKGWKISQPELEDLSFKKNKQNVSDR
ncbi:MAG: hypothetical protein HYU39_09335 [Thaumarchaeota archaeon]|nr:hypothetical protein [Nitrososphaerota archaeon]